MPQYTSNIVSLSVPTGAARVFFLPANPSRVSLIVSAATFVVARVAFFPGSLGEGVWVAVLTQFAVPLTYRDYGPPMRDAVWLSHSGAGSVTLIATEILKIPGC
jgi:hypothetical protein